VHAARADGQDLPTVLNTQDFTCEICRIVIPKLVNDRALYAVVELPPKLVDTRDERTTVAPHRCHCHLCHLQLSAITITI
jgi:protein-disulfide isomerase